MSCLTKLTLDLPVSEAVRRLLLDQMGEIQNQAHLSVTEADDLAIRVAAVHDLRVALRRVLTILEIYSPWLERGWVRKTRKGYRNLLKPLGVMRDLDVLLEQTARIPPAAAGYPAELAPLLEQERNRRLAELLALMGSRDFQKWLSRQTSRLVLPESVLEMALPAITRRGEVQLFRLRDCLPVILYAAAASLTAYHGAIPDSATLPEDLGQDQTAVQESTVIADNILHRLRVTAKGFRYALEAHQSVLGPAARELIREFKDFQDLLGNWHDAVIALTYLGKLSLAGEDPRCAAWQAYWQGRRTEMQAAFLQKWPELTPAWFHQRLAVGLDYALNKGCPKDSPTGRPTGCP